MLTNAALAIGLSVLGLLVCFALLWWQVLVEPQQADGELQRERLLNTYTQLFNGRIAELREQVDSIATAPQATAALANFDAAAASAVTDAIVAQNPYILRADIVQRGKAEVDLSAEIPISFAALDLLRRAETREFVGPEVSLNQRNLIYAAQPITANGMVAGVMLVVFDTQFFLSQLAHFDASQNSLQVIQKFEGSQDTVVMQWGQDNQSTLPVMAQLYAPHWSLALRADPNTLVTARPMELLLMPAALALLVTIAAIFLGFSRYTRMLRGDAEVLGEFVHRLLRGRPAQIGGFQLTLLKDVADSLLPYAKQTAAQATDAAPAEPQQEDSVADLLADLDAEDAGDKEDDFLEVRQTSDSADNFGIEVSEEEHPVATGLELDQGIFRAYDIRGITSENLTEEVVYWIGRAFASEAIAQGNPRVAIGWDGRNSSEALRQALTRGLTESGADVLPVGQVPTPMLYYATYALDTGTGIMITGSHNPPEYNGLKMMIGGVTLAEERIQTLYQRIVEGNLDSPETHGEVEEISLEDSYVDKVLEDVALAQSLKVVVDCGNGVAGGIAPRLLEELGCEVIPLYCEVDGDFPNHHPDPAEAENLEDLITVVQAEKADVGLAFDGDGDRVGVVTATGEIIWPDKVVMLFAQDIVNRNPGADIIYDVKCGRHLNTLISELGGRPIMWKTGHSHIKAKIKETGALLGGEFSGHICFNDRWYGFDDALYSAARLLEILAMDGRGADEIFDQFPKTVSTPELKIQTTEEAKFEVMGRLEVEGEFGAGTLTNIDGIRVDFADGWGLIRPSNTSPVLSLRFEADNEEALNRIQDIFQAQLSRVDDTLSFR